MILLFLFCEFIWILNPWQLNNPWRIFDKLNLMGWVNPRFPFNDLERIGPCSYPASNRMANVPLVPYWKHNDLKMSSSKSMALLFYTYDFISTFTYDKYVSNMPCPVFDSVKIHRFIVGLEDTAFKCNKNGKCLERENTFYYHSGCTFPFCLNFFPSRYVAFSQ